MPRRVRAVLAGCGSISGAWLSSKTVRKRVEIAALVDVRKSAAKEKRAEYGLSDAVVSTDLAATLAAVKPDVVFDCTVPQAHRDVTLTALSHGCHVLGEKPLADTMSNARKMVAAAKRAGKIYAVIQNRRYQAEIRGLRRFLDSGRIGKVTSVQSNFFLGAHFGGFRDKMRHVLLVDMAIHTVDAARFLTAADARHVYCHEWNPAESWYAHGAAAVAVFEMTGGIVYTYQGSWCAEGCSTTWEADWRITGTKGSVLWDGADGIRAEVVSGKKGFMRKVRQVRVPRVKLARAGHDGVIGEFIDCVERGGVPDTVSSDNIKSLAMVHSAVESATLKKRVRVKA